MIALLDNTVLSNFALVGGPDLLRLVLGDTAAAVSEVLAEYQAGAQLGRLPPYDWAWLPVLSLNETERVIYHRLRARLNPGEAACLALAVGQGHRVLTDDRTARQIAMQMGVPVSGTLGLLLRLVAQGHLSLPEADNLLSSMITSGYRSPVASLTDLA